jgi:transposase
MPETGIVIRRSGKYQTVFKKISSFRTPGKLYPDGQRVTIGKLDKDTGLLVPNSNYWKLYHEEPPWNETIYRSVISIGPAFLADHTLNALGITSILDECFGQDRARKIRTAALYMISRGNVFDDVENFCDGYTINGAHLTSQSSSVLFATITHDERMAFFKKWSKVHQFNSHLAYDVTSFSTYAKGIEDSEYGYNRDCERLPQINFGCYLSQATALPMFYVTYPGSIIDKSHLTFMMAYNEDLGISDMGFVLDRGFCSKDNIIYMVENGLDFYMGIESRLKITQEAIESVRPVILKFDNCIDHEGIFGIAVPGKYYGFDLNLHVYYNPDMADDQRKDLYRLIQSEEETLSQLKTISHEQAKHFSRHFVIDRDDNGLFKYSYNTHKIDKKSLNFGYFSILTNTTVDSKQLLSIYRRRDTIEKCFDDLKNHIDMKRLRTHVTETTAGKMYCSFIALILISEIGNKLRPLLQEKAWSKKGVIAELEKIKVLTSTSGKRRLMNPLTKTQRMIFQPFGLKESDLEIYVKTEAKSV